jgi:hypothetical protein
MSASKFLLLALFALSAVMPMNTHSAKASSPPSIPHATAQGHKNTVYNRYHHNQPWHTYASYPNVRQAISVSLYLEKHFQMPDVCALADVETGFTVRG